MDKNEAIARLLDLTGQELHQLANVHGVTVIRNGKVNKGWAGHVFERYLGLPINSSRSPNFGSWELKSIPLKYKKNGELTFKETMAITMIDPVNICQKEFEESHLLAKINKAVVVARIVGEDAHAPSYVYSVTELNFTDDLYEAVKSDYDLVRNTLLDDPVNGFGRLTGKMGVYIQPRTKGQGHGSTTRAFYARAKFLAKFIPL